MTNEERIKIKKYRSLIWILTGIFIYQCLYFIFNIPFGIPPDEAFHIKQVLFEINTLNPANPHTDLDVRAATEISSFPLYYILISRIFAVYYMIDPSIAQSPSDYLIIFRLSNLFLIILYLFFFYKISLMIMKSLTSVVLAFFIQANILMFGFMAAAVSYDNLVNLISVASIYFLFESIKENRMTSLFSLAVCIGLGTLTKVTFFPLALILITIAALEFRTKPIKEILAAFRKPSKIKIKTWMLSGIVLFLLVINISIHLPVYIKYGTVKPSCAQMYTHAQCLEENFVYAKYAEIRRNFAMPVKETMDPIRYFISWSDYMIEKTIGIFAHESFYQEKPLLGLVELTIIIAILMAARRFELSDRAIVYMTIVVIAYTLLIFYYANLKLYYSTGIMPRYAFIAIQGRYIFPVLALIIILLSHFMTSSQNKYLNNTLAIVAACIFFAAGWGQHIFSEQGITLTPNEELQERHYEHNRRMQEFVP
jgi:hypothetical protein